MPMGLCIDHSQLTGCTGLGDGTSCTFGEAQSGTCHGGVCLAQICGDGIIEAPEQCEANDLADVADCKDLGYYQSGPISCGLDFTYDRRQCVGICGDHDVDAPRETCDAPPGTVVAHCNDATVGFYDPGDVTCNAACQLDTSACTGSCGDGVINGDEICDAAAPTIGCRSDARSLVPADAWN